MRRLAAGVALVLALAACGDGSPAPEAVRESAGELLATTTTEATTTTAAAGPTSTTRAGAGRTTTTARAPAATTTTPAPAPAGPRALTPATPGTYRFDTAGATTVFGTNIAFPAVTTLVVDPPSGTSQRSTRNLRDAAGTGVQTEFNLDYRPDGVYLDALRLTTGFSGVTDVRDLRPASPVLLLATGAGPGAHREADLSGTSSAKLVIDVLRRERVTVGGQALDTLVMRATVTLAPGEVTGRQELTVNIDPGSRLWVKERSVTDASAAGGLFTAHSEHTATLQRLTP